MKAKFNIQRMTCSSCSAHDEFAERFECDRLKEKMQPYRDIVKNHK